MNYNKEYQKNEIIKRICESAIRYKENLLNKNVIFIFENKKSQNIDFIEAAFYDTYYLHLTGMKYYKNARTFFRDCLNNKISPHNIKMRKAPFTQLKLQVLENAMAINKSAKRIGNFNNNKVNITIEKVIGNTYYCIGFSNLDSKNKKLKYYYPKTLLQENLKNNIIDDNKIIAILSKNKNQKLYNKITSLSKETTLVRLKENDLVEGLIDFKTIFSQNLKYQEKINEFLENN